MMSTPPPACSRDPRQFEGARPENPPTQYEGGLSMKKFNNTTANSTEMPVGDQPPSDHHLRLVALGKAD